MKKLNDPAAKAEVEAAQAKAKAFVEAIYQHVPVLDAGARASTNTFVQRGLGDVLLAWENEAFLAIEELGPDEFEIVTPSISMLAEPGVAVVEANASKHGALEAAKEYLAYLYSPEGQKVIAKHYYRPSKPELADAKDVARFPKLELVTVDQVFGGWDEASQTHFVDGGVFDQIYAPK